MITFTPSIKAHTAQKCVYKPNQIHYFQSHDSVSFQSMKSLECTQAEAQSYIRSKLRELTTLNIAKIRCDDKSSFLIEYNPYNHSLTFNTQDLKTIGDCDNTIEKIKDTIQTSKKLMPIVNQYADRCFEIIELKKGFRPEFSFIHSDNYGYGVSSASDNTICFNDYLLKDCYSPEVFVPLMILHEASHNKTFQNSLSIFDERTRINLQKIDPSFKEPNQLLDNLYMGFGYLKSIIKTPESTKEGDETYPRKLWHYYKFLKDKLNTAQSNGLQSKAVQQVNQIKCQIAKQLNIKPQHIYLFNVKTFLEEGKITLNNDFLNVLLSKEEQQSLIDKLEKNKQLILDMFSSKENILKQAFKDKTVYIENYDEALARYNSGIGLLKLIDEGIVEDTETNRELALNQLQNLPKLIIETDEEIKNLIKTAKIKL